MAQERQHVMIGDAKRATKYLANERTFLTWIKMSMVIISLGLVVARFSLWLRELATQLAPQMQTSQVETSMPIGVTMVVLGVVLAVLAAWRYHVVCRAIENGVAMPIADCHPRHRDGPIALRGDDRLYAICDSPRDTRNRG